MGSEPVLITNKHSKWANRPISYVIRDQNHEERPEVYNARYCYLKYEVVVSATTLSKYKSSLQLVQGPEMGPGREEVNDL